MYNLGNTCYLNSTMQILYKLPEFRKAVMEYKPQTPGSQPERLIISMQGLFRKLEGQGEAFEPKEYVSAVFKSFPQFAERDAESNSFQQQDADECFQLILGQIAPLLERQIAQGSIGLVNKLFEIRLMSRFVNKEDATDVGDSKLEVTNKLSCIIDNQANPVNSVADGLKVALEEEVEKYSDVHKRNCVYVKKAALINLPDYMVLQKIRFVWREADAYTKTEARKAKILRNVAFPRVLDLFDFCDASLQQTLTPTRKRIDELAEAEKQRSKDLFEEFKKQNASEEADTYKLYKKYKEQEQRDETQKHDKDLWGDIDVGQDTGNYELVGVITHKGRSSDSGHYVGWVHYRGDKWLKYDDDLVTEVGIEDVLNLRGGGDWHMAYYLVYRKLKSRD